MKYWSILIIVIIISGSLVWLSFTRFQEDVEFVFVDVEEPTGDALTDATQIAEIDTGTDTDDSKTVEDDTAEVETVESSEDTRINVQHTVPFTPQAPFGNWDDERQQEGCEEASVLMAMRWVTGQQITAEEALEEILALSRFQEEQYGFYKDSNVEDTARFMEAYYGFTDYTVVQNFSMEDLKATVLEGSLIILPTNGQLLGNPNFTPPGPLRHMLVVTGFDSQTNVFITNDPGTRNGEGYEYAAEVLFNAIHDYPSDGNEASAEEVHSAGIIIHAPTQ